MGVDIERRDALAQPGELALSVLGPSGQVASTHHWAIACERQPGETVSLQRVHHPAPGTAG